MQYEGFEYENGFKGNNMKTVKKDEKFVHG